MQHDIKSFLLKLWKFKLVGQNNFAFKTFFESTVHVVKDYVQEHYVRAIIFILKICVLSCRNICVLSS